MFWFAGQHKHVKIFTIIYCITMFFFLNKFNTKVIKFLKIYLNIRNKHLYIFCVKLLICF